LERVRNSSSAEGARAVDRAIDEVLAYGMRGLVAGLSAEKQRYLKSHPELQKSLSAEVRSEMAAELRPKYRTQLEEGRRMLLKLSTTEVTEVAEALVGARESVTQPVLEALNHIKPLRDLIRQFADVAAAKVAYSKGASLRPGTWVHTPTVVVSWN